MQPRYNLELRQSRRLGEQLNFTFQFIRENSRPLMKSLLYIGVPAALVGGFLLSALLFGDAIGVRPSRLLGPIVGVVAVIGCLYMITSVLQAIAIGYTRLYLEGDGFTEITVRDVWRAVREDLGRLIGAMLATGAIMIGIFAILLVVREMRSPFFFIVIFLAVIGMLLYLSIPFSMVPAIRLFERNVSVPDAITRSFELVKGRWWVTFGLFAVLSLIADYVAVSPIIPIRVVLEFTKTFREGGSGESGTLWLIIMLVVMVLSYFASFLLVLGATLHYFNLAEKQDSVGLLGRINAIGAGDNAVASHHSL